MLPSVLAFFFIILGPMEEDWRESVAEATWDDCVESKGFYERSVHQGEFSTGVEVAFSECYAKEVKR